MTNWVATRCCARRRLACRCGSATTVISRICRPRGRQGIEPTIVRLPGIGLDIDHPADLRTFVAARPRMPTRTLALLERFGL